MTLDQPCTTFQTVGLSSTSRYGRPNQSDEEAQTEAQDSVAVTTERGRLAGVAENRVVLHDSGAPITLPPPPPYSPKTRIGLMTSANSVSSVTRVALRGSTAPTGTQHNAAEIPCGPRFAPSNITSNSTLSQHLIAAPSSPVVYVREVAKRLYYKRHPFAPASRTTYTLVHKRFDPSGNQVFPVRFDEMLDDKALWDYSCINEDSRVEVTKRRTRSTKPLGNNAQEEEYEMEEEAATEGRQSVLRASGEGTNASLELSWPQRTLIVDSSGVSLGAWVHQ
ncbi:hypothetical protein BDZ91DRAFT_790167 [Kalaharituber pfeilii]|nr:hypothetical protein BDZ91DRAFT_790167 [Kalaharituber pfeilii]